MSGYLHTSKGTLVSGQAAGQASGNRVWIGHWGPRQYNREEVLDVLEEPQSLTPLTLLYIPIWTRHYAVTPRTYHLL